MKAKDLRGRFSYLSDNIRVASSNIAGSSLRSALTIAIITLGITCLVGSQTAIDCLGGLLNAAFGTNAARVSITALHSRDAGIEPVSYIEAAAFRNYFESGKSALYSYLPPMIQISVNGRRLGPQTTVMAIEGDWLECNGISVGQGRYAGPGECIIGEKTAATICRRGGGSAIGKQLNIGGKAFTVAGITKKQSTLLGALTDNTVYILVSSAMGSLMNEQSSCSIDLMLPSGAAYDTAVESARNLMRKIRRLQGDEDPDFEIIEGSAAVREIERLGGSLSAIAMIIGLLTLCGAAVALANIMLVCVAERTREVGIRRAVGATKGDIRASFITEAVIICEAGCLAGTLLGILCGNILSTITHTGFSIPWDWILLSQAISTIVGILACALPARRASNMNVVEALRCE